MRRASRLYCTPEAYHADQIGEKRPSLNQSIATTLIQKSPLHAWQEHPRLGGTVAAATPEMDTGAMVHALVLGKGATIEAFPYLDWRTKEAREARDECRFRGRIPVLEHKFAEIQMVAGEISAKVGHLLNGESEVQIAWEENGTLCRGQLDHLASAGAWTAGRAIYDLKLVSSANPKVLARKAIEGGWGIQSAAYRSAVEHLEPTIASRVEFILICCEVDAPFAITICRLGNVLEQLGEEQWKRAVKTWATCLESGVWSGYGDDIVTLEAPAFAISELEAEVERG